MKATDETDVMGVRATPEAGEVPDDVTEETLRGATVHDRQGAKIGTVDDVTLASDGRVASVVIEIGGYLGIGSHPVAVDAHRLSVRDEGEGTRIVLGMTREELRELPEQGEPITPPVAPPGPR